MKGTNNIFYYCNMKKLLLICILFPSLILDNAINEEGLIVLH